MKKNFLAKITLLATLIFFISCKNSEKDKSDYVIIETEYGNIKIKLYDETPKHKQNFLKLVKEGYYDNQLFHRVIRDFMIQGGDPDSKNAEKGILLGNGGPGYTIPAEINENLFHKKGVIAAARQGDELNPDKFSSGSQFYIVQGKKYSETELRNMEGMINTKKNQSEYRKYLNKHPEILTEIQTAQEKGEFNKVDSILAQVKSNVKFTEFKFSDEAVKAYTQIGGTPFLDGQYTVFGEVTEGLEVIDKIAENSVDSNNRPHKDIKMKIRIEKK